MDLWGSDIEKRMGCKMSRPAKHSYALLLSGGTTFLGVRNAIAHAAEQRIGRLLRSPRPPLVC